MISRAELKSSSKIQLKGYWTLAVLTLLCYNIILQGTSLEFSQSIFGENSGVYYGISIAGMLLYGPIQVGSRRFLLKLAKKESEAKFKDLFSGFDVFFKSLFMTLLIFIAITVGTLLLVIPGIIATFMFSQSFFILAENPHLSSIECLKKSAKMMKGHKFDFFVLELSFLGWIFACVFTFGIGLLWYTPYYEMTVCNFYLQLKEDSID